MTMLELVVEGDSLAVVVAVATMTTKKAFSQPFDAKGPQVWHYSVLSVISVKGMFQTLGMLWGRR